MDTTVTQAQSKEESINDDALFMSLTNDMRSIEAQLLPQLEELQEKIPEIYKGYANIVRETVSATINMIATNSNTANKIALGAEIAARGLEAFGQWKAAKKHNELLSKFMHIKQTIAQNNIQKIDKLLQEVKHKLSSSKKLMKKYSQTFFPCSKNDEKKIRQIASLNLRALNLYRTNLFLLELSTYLSQEYSTWLSGKQTSGIEMPDYYKVNDMILKNLFGKEPPFNVLEKCADGNGDMTGAQMMLMADYQLSIYALKDTLCTISPEEASPTVKVLLDSNPGFAHYSIAADGVIEHISNPPGTAICVAWLVAMIAIVALCVFYIPGSVWLRLLIGISGVVATYKIYSRNLLKLNLIYCQTAEEIIAEADEQIATKCGKIKQQEIDYEHKNASSAFISGFLGI